MSKWSGQGTCCCSQWSLAAQSLRSPPGHMSTRALQGLEPTYGLLFLTGAALTEASRCAHQLILYNL
jgi:hypothetical protein